MRANLVKKVVVMIVFVITIALVSNCAYAASISIAAGSTNLTVGSSTTLTIRGNDVIGKINITSSNPGVISLSSSQEWIEGAVTIRATAKAAGNAYITVTSVDTSSSTTGEAVSVSTGVNLTSNAVVVDTRSSNNYLSSLTVEGYELSPGFNTNTNNYTMNVKSDVSEIKLSAIPADNKSTTIVDGNLDLVAGENNVTVTVTAENGYKRVYTIVVTKEKNPDDIDASLSSLVINNATLKNEFDSEVFEYMCDDIYADTQKLDITLETKIPDLKYEIIGNDELKHGINHIIIKVTSRDGSVTKEYEIIVFKSDEVLALQEVENVIEETENSNTFMDKIKEVKKEIIFCGIALVCFIVLIIVIIVNKKKTKKDEIEDNDSSNNFFASNEDNNENNNYNYIDNEDSNNDNNIELEEFKDIKDNDNSDIEDYNYIQEELQDKEPRVRKGSITPNIAKKDINTKTLLKKENDLEVSQDEIIEDGILSNENNDENDSIGSIVINKDEINLNVENKSKDEVKIKLDLSKLDNKE